MLTFKEFCKIEEENAAKRMEKAYQKNKELRRSRNFCQLTPIGRVLIDSLRSRNRFVFLVVSALQMDSWHESKGQIKTTKTAT